MFNTSYGTPLKTYVWFTPHPTIQTYPPWERTVAGQRAQAHLWIAGGRRSKRVVKNQTEGAAALW